jgi:hypothetical protein
MRRLYIASYVAAGVLLAVPRLSIAQTPAVGHVGAGAADGPYRLEAALYSDDFSSVENWIPELEKPGSVDTRGGALNVDVPAGATVWFRYELTGPVMIEYDATLVKAGGPNDRVSDLNCFWMASDARSPGDLFATQRSGRFADYDRLLTYYVGQGGNNNSTTRFRRYIGRQDNRPLLPQHNLSAAEFLVKPNVFQKIQLVAFHGHIQYLRDGRTIFDFTDPDPYTHGYFAFRTTASHLRIRHFRVYRLMASEP